MSVHGVLKVAVNLLNLKVREGGAELQLSCTFGHFRSWFSNCGGFAWLWWHRNHLLIFDAHLHTLMQSMLLR
jgi:hypothetical protein